MLINCGGEYCLCGNVGFHECQHNLQDRRSHGLTFDLIALYPNKNTRSPFQKKSLYTTLNALTFAISVSKLGSF